MFDSGVARKEARKEKEKGDDRATRGYWRGGEEGKASFLASSPFKILPKHTSSTTCPRAQSRQIGHKLQRMGVSPSSSHEVQIVESG